MALPFFNWSRTAASNATADSTVNWAEGQAPSSVNDSARAMMASTAAYRDDIAGAITTGGAATAYTVTSYQVFSSLAVMANQVIAFVPHATNTNAVGVDITLNVDGLGAKSIRMQPSVALPNGTLVLGTPYIVVYNNVDAVFYLRNMTNPYNIPLGAGMDFWGATAPNTSFAFPAGQAISRTTYATLFALVSTTYGAGDTTTTFNLPNKTGRISAMKESVATLLTSTYFGTSTALGSTGGQESRTILAANLPAYTPAGTNASGGGSFTYSTTSIPQGGGVGINAVTGLAQTGQTTTVNVQATQPTFTGTAQGGIDTPIAILPPMIMCNYIIRII